MKRPVADLDADTDPVSIAHKGRPFVDAVLEAWKRELERLMAEYARPLTSR